MIINERLTSIRTLMKKEGLSGYVQPSSDPHLCEYVPDRFKGREWLSGFSGSAGTLVVLEDIAALWTDGRYFIQASKELEGSGIELMKMGLKETPSIVDWIAKNIEKDSTIALDGRLFSLANIDNFKRLFKEKNIKIRDEDLLDKVWKERPKLDLDKAWVLSMAYAGESAKNKINKVKDILYSKKTDSLLVSSLESIAWLTNLRANDMPYLPLLRAYFLITSKEATLFVYKESLDEEIEKYLEIEGINVRPYDSLHSYIEDIKEPLTFLYDKSSINYSNYLALAKNQNLKLVLAKDPIPLLKAIRNEKEIENIKNAHIKDGIAMVKFQIALEKLIKEDADIREYQLASLIRQIRLSNKDCFDESFQAIVAVGANAAMMHYGPKEESSASIRDGSFLLVDSGGQYRDGTTDITRTYPLKELSKKEKEYFTLVLKSHINLATAVFPEGTSGVALDSLARINFWKRGLDYRCGTGHGVSFVGNVHEGPTNISPRASINIEAGMVVTDEPGIYEEGFIGIRIENELLCKVFEDTDYGRFLKFEVLTYCPISTEAIEKTMLTNEEINWINKYHEKVYDNLSQYLFNEEKEWLQKACANI